MESNPCICLLILSFLSLIIHQITKLLLKTTPGPLPPGPKGWPVIGYLPQMIRNRPASRWIHNLMHQQNTEIFTSRPECMSGKLSTNDFLSIAISPAGPHWKKMRKIVSMEVLSPSMHKFLHAKRCDEADHLVIYVLNRCVTDDRGLVDVRATTQHYCGNMIRKLIFGKRFFGQGADDGGPGNEEIEHVAVIFSILQNLYGFGIADYAPRWMFL